MFNQYYFREDSESKYANTNVHLNKNQQNLLHLQNSNWNSMLDESVMLGEHFFAKFCHWLLFLDDLYFKTSEDRKQCMDQWKAGRMDLAAMHASWDKWGTKLQHILADVFLFNEYKISLTFAIQSGLFVNLKCLDSAFWSASTRMPRRCSCTQELLDRVCIICQSPLLVLELSQMGITNQTHYLTFPLNRVS